MSDELKRWQWSDCGVHDVRIYEGKSYIGRVATAESAQLICDSHNAAVRAAVEERGEDAKLRNAAEEALLGIAAWRTTDREKPYAEISPTLRSQFNKAHDLLVEALAQQSGDKP